MKSLSRLAWMLTFTALFSGCAKLKENFGRQHGGTTLVSVSTSRSGSRLSPNAILNGGLMVYAVGSDGTQLAFPSLDESLPLTMAIPNGTYTFYAMGWDTGPVQGTPRCGVSSQQYTLTGTSTDVFVSMAPAYCSANALFAPPIAYSGSNLLPLEVVFCANGTSLAAKTAANDCTSGFESAFFAKGNNAATMKDGRPFSSLGLIMYMANPTSNTVQELFVNGMDGKNIRTRLSPPPPASSTGVQLLDRVPGTNKALFIMNEGPSTAQDLWLVDLDIFAATGSVSSSVKKISHSTPVGLNGVKEFRVSPDGAYVVFVSDAIATGLYDLFSVPLAGPTYPAPTQISGARSPNTNTGIYKCPSCGGNHQWFFEISPNTAAPYVAYSSEQNTTGIKDLYIAALNGGNVATTSNINGTAGGVVPSGTKISGAEANASSISDFLTFTQDGAHFLYHLSTNAPADKIYSIDVTLNTTTSNLTTSVPNLIAPSSAVGPYYTVSNSGTKAIFYIRPSTQIIVAYVDLAAPGTTYTLTTLNTAETSISRASFSSNDNHAVVASADAGFNPVHVFSLKLSPAPSTNNPANTYWDHSGLLTSPQKIWSSSASGGDVFQIDPTDTYVAFSADKNTSTFVELFYGTLGSNGATAISGGAINAANKSVSAYGVAPGGMAYFAAGIDTPGSRELYSTSLTASPTITRIGSLAYIGDIMEIDAKNFPAGRAFVSAHPLANAGATEGMLYDSALSGNPFTSFGPLPDGTIPGLGRMRVSVMKYGPGYAGAQPAFQSACLGYPNGTVAGGSIKDITNPIKVPVGPSGGGSSPFAVAVDVYPLATSCAGTPVRYFFPQGLMSGSGSLATKLTADSSSFVKLFISDR